MKKMLPVITISVLLDQIIKILVILNMNLYQSINIINNFFKITYVRNNGAAWSILSGSRFFLITISIIACFLIYFYFIKNKELKKPEIFSYGILLGGTIGNLIDRIIHGYVIDYLDFKIFNYDFPIFNIADICIVIGIIFICIIMIGGELNARNKNK